jgi:hypothetical protein
VSLLTQADSIECVASMTSSSPPARNLFRQEHSDPLQHAGRWLEGHLHLHIGERLTEATHDADFALTRNLFRFVMRKPTANMCLGVDALQRRLDIPLDEAI